MKTVRLGSATGWSRDRFEPAADLVRRGRLDYLCFDSMSEVTMSAAQVARLENDRVPPYDPYLEARLEPILADCKSRGVRIVTNKGWLDPVAAAGKTVEVARRLGIRGLKVAAVFGGMLTDRIADMVRKTRAVSGYTPKPILFNEDDHFDFAKPENNFTAAVSERAGWGYFDFRMKGEGFDEGYQSVPVNWGISSERKRGFFKLLAEMTGAR